MSKPTLVILAAGVGSRYGGLKQLAPVGPSDEALLEYSVYDAVRGGFSRVVLVVRPQTEAAFRQRFAGRMADRVALSYAHQTLDDLPGGSACPPGRVKPWGTGQAVLAASAQLDGPFCVINADDFYGADAYTAMAGFLGRPATVRLPAAVVGFAVEQTLSEAGAVSRALCRGTSDGRLREIVEIKEVWRQDGDIVYRDRRGVMQTLQGKEPVSMNMWGFPRAMLPELKELFEHFMMGSINLPEAEFLLPDAVQDVIHTGRAQVTVLPGTGPWCGITFPEDEARTAALLASWVDAGLYPKELWAD